MKKFLLALVAFATFATPVFAQTVYTQPKMSLQGVAPQDLLAVFPALTAVGQTDAISLVSDPGTTGLVGNERFKNIYVPKFHTIQATVTGAPTGCSYTVYGTTKLPQENPVYPTDYFALGTANTCTTSGAVFISNSPVTAIVINLATFTGGTSPTITFRYLGVH